MAEPFTTKKWAIWVQPDGPNTDLHYLGCHTLEDVAIGGGGIKDLIRCFKSDGSGWTVLGTTRNPPEQITSGITGLIMPAADWLERIVEGANCPFPLYINGKTCPPYDVFGGASRWYALETAEIGATGLTGLAHREEDNVSEQSFEISAQQPLLRGRAITTKSIINTELANLNDIASCSSPRCVSDCGAAVNTCDTMITGSDDDPGVAGLSHYSNDNGETWIPGVEPFPLPITADVKSVVCFPIDSDTTRWLAARDLEAIQPMDVSYCDDGTGTIWVEVELPSTDAFGATNGGSMFALDMYHIWLVIRDAAVASEMFFSDDGGLTWTEQVLPAGLYNAVWFSDENTGMVVGDAGATATTTDGGATWELAGIPAAVILHTVGENAGGGVWWTGTANGNIWYSEDYGATWLQRAFPGDGAGAVFDLEFTAETVGFMAHSPTNATGIMYRTRNGGLTWEAISATVAGELYSVHACTINQAFAVGELAPTNPLILKSSDY